MAVDFFPNLQTALYEIAQAVNTTGNLSELYGVIHRILGQLMPADNFYIALYDPLQNRISFPYFVDQFDPPPAPKPPGKGLTEYVLRTGLVLLATPRVFEDLVRAGEVELIGEPSLDWLGAPLKVEDRTIGVIVLQTYTEGIRYTKEHARVLEFVSAQVAMAIERKRSDEALRFQAFLLDQIRDRITATDLEGRIIYVNAAEAEMMQRTPEEMIGQSVELHGEDARRGSAQREIVTRTLAHGEWQGEIVNCAKDGTERTLYLRTWTVHDKDGKPAGLCGISTDITDQKRAEEERRKLEAQMQHTQKLESLGVLAGGIAHDFNNLLMAILGNADLALSRLPADSPARENLADIERASRRASELCRQMLAYSGRGRFVVEPLSLSATVREMVQMLEVSISKKAALRYHLAEDLPAVDADATQVRQVVMNLITNASDAIGDGNGVISISTGTRYCDRSVLSESYLDDRLAEGRYAYLEVADNGCGMDRNTLARIFDPFFTTKFTGRGLGLAAVLGIVRGHRGAIKVESEPGRGTTFTVLFPVSARRVRAVSRPGTASRAWRGTGTVLLVDDDDSVLSVGRQMIQRSGFRVLTAPNGREALEVFQNHADEVVCVVLDLTMPVMGGEETFRELRRLRPQVPVIMSSGFDELEVRDRLSGAGLTGFIQKPYDSTELRARLQEATG
jgi:two-component system cell cycle sensor histidine kinase/response regulator CckA